MALERPPRLAAGDLESAKSYRPSEDQVAEWHTVLSGQLENFRTIASRHQVPVDKIIAFNFPGSVENGRVITEVVNWYLGNHKGFGGPETVDRRNRMFKGGEKVAIPFMGRVELGMPIILAPRKPVSLDQPGSFFATEKFVHEFKLPPKPVEIGHFLAQARISIEGEIIQQGSVKTQFKKDQVKAQIERKLDEDLKATFSIKADEKTLTTVVDEIRKGSKEGFARALAAPFEASLKQNYKFGRFVVVPELGAEFSTTPVVVRVAGEYQDILIVEGTSLHGKFSIKIGFNVGLSKKGWAWVAERVGTEALERFLQGAGRATAGMWQYLVAEGIVAAGAIVAAAAAGTIAVTTLMAWLVADARRKGELRGLASWYYAAYLAKVFRRPRPSGFIVGDVEMRDELIIMGEKDAVNAARQIVEKRGEANQYQSEDAVLARYREIAAHVFGNEVNAEIELKKALQSYIEKQVGL